MVGICAWQLKEADELKRSALLCDVVEVPSKLDFASNLIGSSDCSPQVFDEVSKAMGGGPISVNEALFDVARPYVRKFQELHFLHQAGLLRFRPHDWAGPPSPASGPQTTWTAPSELYVEAPRGTLRLSVEEIEQLPELTARIRAASLRSQPEEEFVLIGSRFPNLEAWVSELPPVQTDVVNITLEQLAEPDGQTPWQDLIEFRNDDNSRQQQLALRRWMRKMASGDFKQFEIAEELEYLYTSAHN